MLFTRLYFLIVLFKPKSNRLALIAIVPPSAQPLKRQQATAHRRAAKHRPPSNQHRALSVFVSFCLVLSCHLRSPHCHRRENNARCSIFLYFALLCSIFLYFSLFILIAIVRISLTLYVLLLLPAIIILLLAIMLLLLLLLLLCYYYYLLLLYYYHKPLLLLCYYYITIIVYYYYIILYVLYILFLYYCVVFNTNIYSIYYSITIRAGGV